MLLYSIKGAIAFRLSAAQVQNKRDKKSYFESTCGGIFHPGRRFMHCRVSLSSFSCLYGAAATKEHHTFSLSATIEANAVIQYQYGVCFCPQGRSAKKSVADRQIRGINDGTPPFPFLVSPLSARIQYTPSLVCKPLSSFKCIHVACGGQHTIAVTDDDDVYGFGSDRHGQLGLGKRHVVVPVPSR